MRQCKALSSPAHGLKKNTWRVARLAFKAGCARQVAAGTRRTHGARAQGVSPALPGRWQRQACEAAVPNHAARDAIKRLRAALKRLEMARDRLKKAVAVFAQPPRS